MTSPFEQLGRTAGWIASPAFAAIAALRHARVFHPAGELLEGTVEVGAPPDDVEELAEALEGSVLVRFSGALWKKPGSHLPDVLGCALRIKDGGRGAQDLLFATIRRPWTMGLSPLTTHVDDYLANHYFAVSPFAFHGMARRFYLRLRPLQRGGPGEDRRERLARARGGADRARARDRVPPARTLARDGHRAPFPLRCWRRSTSSLRSVRHRSWRRAARSHPCPPPWRVRREPGGTHRPSFAGIAGSRAS